MHDQQGPFADSDLDVPRQIREPVLYTTHTRRQDTVLPPHGVVQRAHHRVRSRYNLGIHVRWVVATAAREARAGKRNLDVTQCSYCITAFAGVLNAAIDVGDCLSVDVEELCR